MRPKVAFVLLLIFFACKDRAVYEKRGSEASSRIDAIRILKNCRYDDACFDALRELKRGRFKPESEADEADVALAEIKIFIEASVLSLALGTDELLDKISGIVFALPVSGSPSERLQSKARANLKFLMKGYSQDENVRKAGVIADAFLDYKCADINELLSISDEVGLFQNTASLAFLAIAYHFLRSTTSMTAEDIDSMRKSIAGCLVPKVNSPSEQIVEVLRLFYQHSSLIKESAASGNIPKIYSSTVEKLQKDIANLSIPVNYEYVLTGTILNARLPLIKWNVGLRKIPEEIFVLSEGKFFYAPRAVVEVKEGEIVSTGRSDFEEIFDFNRNFTADEFQHTLKESLKVIFKDFDFANSDREIFIAPDREESVGILFLVFDAFLVHGRFFFNLGMFNEDFKEAFFLPVNYRYPARKITLGDGLLGKFDKKHGKIRVEITNNGFTILFPDSKTPLLIKSDGGIFNFAGLYNQLAAYRETFGEANVSLLFDRGLSIDTLIKTYLTAHYKHYTKEVTAAEFERGFLAADQATGKTGLLFRTIFVE